MKYIITLFILFIPQLIFTQNPRTDTLSLLFMGDIMGHDSQIHAAYNAKDTSYNYDTYFTHLKGIIDDADFTVANLELTLAGPPFKGYPKFSSPDALAYSIKKAGIDILTTANNHSCDRGKEGLLRTIKILDSLGIKHTGTFRDTADRKLNHPLFVKKNGFKIAFLNYTYGTNGLRVTPPASVNYIRWKKIKQDIKNAQKAKADQIIVLFHWGKQYESQPNDGQEKLFNYCKALGANIVIGSHPHVLQKMEWNKKENKESLVAYSLGNFISNQRKRKRDGGAMVKITLTKTDSTVSISDAGYYLTWVYKPIKNKKYKFTILPASKFERQYPDSLNKTSSAKMKLFIKDSRKLLNKENLNFPEYLYNDSLKTWDNNIERAKKHLSN
jgi:poly-gamma-glutamate synthesis protein (capsule biosynthesis protein)